MNLQEKKLKKIILVGSRKDNDIYNSLIKELREKSIYDQYEIKQMHIFGLYTHSSIIKVFPDNIVYVDITQDDIPELVKEAFLENKVIEKFLYKNESVDVVKLGNIPFYHKQFRIVLRNSGIIDPENIDEYIERNGYRAFSKVLSSLKPDDIIKELEKSGLRGRGGGGFPTWMKWKFSKEINNEEKFVICNADEGDPGAYMDRSSLEGDPHSVIEGMCIAAYTVGAKKGYFYVRAEYGLAIERLKKAIKDAREYGFLGDNILGTDFSFDIDIRLGAGAFVCGEETALIASIEGKRGMPKPRPPYPAVKGLWGKPTVINNVETFANIAFIMLKGADWFSKIGTEDSKGTKVFALTGKVKYSGLVEVPMGVTLCEMVYDIGGGILEDKKFKAIQTGGPSGGVIPEQFIDTPISYKTLQDLGSIMGSGGMIVIDETDCMVDISKFYLQFAVDESCGRCSPCRLGVKQLFDLLSRITKGEAEKSDLDLIERLGNTIKKASLCGLGQTAPNPTLSTFKYFFDEYKEHVIDKKCRSGKCENLIAYHISDKCIGCHLCAMKCPVNAITGERKEKHVINTDVCIKCGVCYNICKFKAITKN